MKRSVALITAVEDSKKDRVVALGEEEDTKRAKTAVKILSAEEWARVEVDRGFSGADNNVDPIRIAIVGPLGCGKGTFIGSVLEENDLLPSSSSSGSPIPLVAKCRVDIENVRKGYSQSKDEIEVLQFDVFVVHPDKTARYYFCEGTRMLHSAKIPEIRSL